MALATTTGIPAMAACSTAERQAPLPPRAAGPGTGAAPSPASSAPPSGGVSVPLTADKHGSPTSDTAGADGTPGSADSTGGLRPRPGNAPGSAESASSVPNGYRIGARAPWGILLDDRPQPGSTPKPVPAPHRTGTGGTDGGQQPEKPVPPQLPAGGGRTILADGDHPAVPAVKVSSVKVGGPTVAPGQAKKDTSAARPAPGQGLPASISFSSLLSVLPPSATTIRPTPGRPSSDDEHRRKGRKAAASESDHSAHPAKHGSSSSKRRSAAVALSLPSPPGAAPHPSATPAHPPTSAPRPESHRPAPQLPAPQPAATGWHIDGLALANVAPPVTGNGGSPRFRKALRAALAARPHAQRPRPAALRRWSAAIQKAASLAPDRQTKVQLSTLARYASELADTPAPKRAALQAKRPAAVEAASALRTSLPQRFGVRLLD